MRCYDVPSYEKCNVWFLYQTMRYENQRLFRVIINTRLEVLSIITQKKVGFLL